MILEYLDRLQSFIDFVPICLFEAIFRTKPKPTDYDWHKYGLLSRPKVRLAGGAWSTHGQLWRRRRHQDGRWEYKQDPETMEEWEARQW